MTEKLASFREGQKQKGNIVQNPHVHPAYSLFCLDPCFLPPSWSEPSHVKMTELVLRLLQTNAFFLKGCTVKEKCLLFLSSFSYWNGLKIIFRQQLLIITEKAFHDCPAQALAVVEMMIRWLTASFYISLGFHFLTRHLFLWQTPHLPYEAITWFFLIS